MIDPREFEGAAGDVDANDFGPIFLMRRSTGSDVMRARCGVVDREMQVTDIEVIDPALSVEEIVVLFERAYLIEFANDYYRGDVDRITLAWADGTHREIPYPVR